jgi:hypothetical protein
VAPLTALSDLKVLDLSDTALTDRGLNDLPGIPRALIAGRLDQALPVAHEGRDG